MAYRLALHENVEHEVYHRLTNYGHDVTHVDFVSTLGKGVDDRSIANYSRETNRIIVTYDDDFALEMADKDYRGAFYIHDDSLPVQTVADIIHAISKQYPQSEVIGPEYVGEDWL
jgi:uncharacterized protein with PIN domain